MTLSIELLKTEWLFPTTWLKAFRNERLGRKAEEMTALFRATARMPVWDVQDSPEVLDGRRFFKQLPTIADPRIDACSRELLALKLGITSDVFASNDGFEKFAAESHLERYLLEYHQELQVNDNKCLSILMDGQYVPWKQAEEAMSQFPKHIGSPLQPWMYGPEGIQNGDMYDWSRFKPYKQANLDEWGRRYVFELVVFCGNTPHKTGDHSWLRLRTPEGDVYGVGLYRPQKRGGLEDNVKLPFRVKRGYLMMPDITEFWPGERRFLRVGITEEQFHTMVEAIEEDKRQDQLVFQLFQSNCVLWAAHIAKKAGITIPVGSSSLGRLLTPRRLEPLLDMVPSSVKKVAERIAAFIFNLSQLALGAGVVDQDVIQHNGPNVRPHIASWRDLFDPKKMILYHPSTFGNDTLRAVKKWRAEQVERLKAAAVPDLQRRIEEIQYLVPA